MVDPGTPPSTKVRAAEAILAHGAKAIEIEDIDARVSELERAAEALKQHRSDCDQNEPERAQNSRRG